MWTRLTFECDGMQARLPHSACRSPGRGEGWGVTPCETSASDGVFHTFLTLQREVRNTNAKRLSET